MSGIKALVCDNHETCGSVSLGQGSLLATEDRARVKGWHIFHGSNGRGEHIDSYLCNLCVGSARRPLPPAPPVLPGQMDLF